LGIMEWVAIYGAVIGSISAFLYLRNWWYDRPHIKVKVAYALGGAGVTEPLDFISLSAVNTGKQTVQLTGAGFELEEGRNLWFTASPPGIPQHAFPTDLAPNNKCDVYFSLPELVNTLIEKNKGQTPRSAWFTDATNKKPYKKAIDPAIFSNWVKLASKTN